MHCHTSGIILHTTPYSENSLIVKIFTRELGIQSCITNSIRGKKSKKVSFFQPLSIIDLVILQNNKSGLQRINEISIKYIYSNTPYDIVKSSIALFVNEVLYKSIREEHPDEDLFDFIEHSLQILDLKAENCSNFHIGFMCQLSRYLGFYPQGKYSPQTPHFDLRDGRFVADRPIHQHYLENAVLLYRLLNTSYDTLQDLYLRSNERKELLQALILFYQLHITGFGEMRSHTVLEEVLV